MSSYSSTPKKIVKRGVLLFLIIMGLFIVSMVNAQVASSSTYSITTELLKWAPPILNNPIVVNVLPNGNNTIQLESNQDYIINLPNEPVTEAVKLFGGHNIVLIGGEIAIPYQGEYASRSSRTALKIQKATGTVHIEGILMHGEDISEGIQIDAPNAIVQIQNVRIMNIHARDQINFTDNHPDLIQPYGSVSELRIDRFTGSTDYQGFMLKSDFNAPLGSVKISNTNIIGLPTSRHLIWLKNVPGAGDVSFENTYLSLPEGTDNSIEYAVWPSAYKQYPNQAQLITTSNCKCVTWPTEMTPRVHGYIYEGTPLEGDFVKDGDVGIGYTTIGYANSDDINQIFIDYSDNKSNIQEVVKRQDNEVASDQQVTVKRLVLVNADTNTDIATIENGMIVNISTLNTRNFNIRAETEPTTVGSVQFSLNENSNFNIENNAPYAMAQDQAGDYSSWQPQLGFYTITATAFSSNNAAGHASEALTFTFEVIESVGSTTVTVINQPPQITNPGNQKHLQNERVSLPIQANDPENKPLSYSATGLPNGLNIDFSTGVISGQMTQSGNYAVEVIVYDNEAISNKVAFNWQVDPIITNPAVQSIDSDTSNLQITSLTLVNADNNQDIMALVEGTTLYLDTLPTHNLSVRAETTNNVKSVVFKLANTNIDHVENKKPYALIGDINGDYNPWQPATGSYTILVTGHSEARAKGNSGQPLIVNFSVEQQSNSGVTVIDSSNQSSQNQPQPANNNTEVVIIESNTANNTTANSNTDTSVNDSNGMSVTTFVLVNADTNQDIMQLTNGTVVNLNHLPTRNLNIRAEVNGNVSSVKFTGIKWHMENQAPYALAGDINGNYSAWQPNKGNHTLTATPYSKSNGKGSAGTSLTVSFKVNK